jgi:hypothetical protein
MAYTKTKSRVERKFFDIIAKEGVLSILSHYDFDFTLNECFIVNLTGDKTEQKKLALNNCVRFYLLNVLRHKDGRLRQPNSVIVELKILIARFKEHGIMFSLATDFWFKGSFSSYLRLVWNQEHHELDATFGNRPTPQHAMSEGYGQTVYAAVSSYSTGLLDTEELFVCQLFFAFLCGTQFLFRGSSVGEKGLLQRIPFSILL